MKRLCDFILSTDKYQSLGVSYRQSAVFNGCHRPAFFRLAYRQRPSQGLTVLTYRTLRSDLSVLSQDRTARQVVFIIRIDKQQCSVLDRINDRLVVGHRKCGATEATSETAG